MPQQLEQVEGAGRGEETGEREGAEGERRKRGEIKIKRREKRNNLSSSALSQNIFVAICSNR